jgi:Cellulase (glycosyl hydrolase family 5)
MRRLLILLVGLVAMLAPSTAFGTTVVALQDDQLPNFRGVALEQRLDQLASTGANFTRVDVLWSEVAPTKPADPRNPNDPAYDWSRYDQIFRGLSVRGIGVIVDFYRTPSWASKDGGVSAAPRAVDGAAFAGAMARRYSGSSTDLVGRVLPEIRRIEVWNEPNIALFWSPQCRPKRRGLSAVAAQGYAALLHAAYREIKAANPRAIVVGGVAGPVGLKSPKRCTTGKESVGTRDFIETLAANNVKLDAWSQHLYPIGSPNEATFFPSWKSLDSLNTLLDKLAPNLPIYVTETGYHTSYNRFHRYYVSEQQQSDWLRDTFTAADAAKRVQLTVWFNVQDNPQWTGGLLHNDLTRKPAWDTFANLAGSRTLPPEWRP